jgi:hypothetical protein
MAEQSNDYKNKKYHHKIQQKLKEMVAQGMNIPAGYSQFMLPYNMTQQGGGSGGVEDQDQYFDYKARKYHHKNQQLCRQIIARGGSVPVQYEKYLLPFSG